MPKRVRENRSLARDSSGSFAVRSLARRSSGSFAVLPRRKSTLENLGHVVSANALRVQSLLACDTLEPETSKAIEENLSEFVAGECIFTSTYSGGLTSEHSAEQVNTAAIQYLGLPGVEPIFYSATENGPMQQNMILVTVRKPMHLFGDVRDRVHTFDLENLEAMETAALQQFAALQSEYRLKHFC